MKITLDNEHEIVSGYGTSVNLVKKGPKGTMTNLGYYATVGQALYKYSQCLMTEDVEYDSPVDYYNEYLRIAKHLLEIEEMFVNFKETENVFKEG